jgi:protein gp37
MTKIEWVKGADGAQGKSWNPVVGCSIASPGCKNCYAMKMAARLEAMGVEHYRGLTKPSSGGAVWTGKVALAPEKVLLEPLKRKKPTMYFVNSMGDLFHESVPDEWILRSLDVVRRTSYDGGSNCGTIDGGRGQHTYQLLTKRSGRMRDFMLRLRFNQLACDLDGEVALYLADDARRPLVLRNLWLGVSVEDQKRADERIPDLLETPAAVRFVSVEPMLGPVDLRHFDLPGGYEEIYPFGAPAGIEFGEGEGPGPRLDWVICGGESGPGARPMHPDWPRSLRDQCQAASVPFFFKQHGEWIGVPDLRLLPGGQGPGFGVFDHLPFDHEHEAVRIGKKRAGRLLDGRTWDEMPSLFGRVEAS